jgi:hypothetical protein
MGMPAPQAVTTVEELLALPDDGLRHELLDGEHVVTPARIYLDPGIAVNGSVRRPRHLTR